MSLASASQDAPEGQINGVHVASAPYQAAKCDAVDSKRLEVTHEL